MTTNRTDFFFAIFFNLALHVLRKPEFFTLQNCI